MIDFFPPFTGHGITIHAGIKVRFPTSVAQTVKSKVVGIREEDASTVPHVSRSGTTAAQSLRLSSFAVHAPRLFNSLPDYIRNTTDCSLNVFKGLLDKFLASVPDKPLIRGYTAYRRADTNSLLDMVRFDTAQSLPGLEEPDNISDAGGGHPWSP